MATSKLIHELRRIVLLQNGAGLTDGQLLECFVEHREEAAFAAMIKRHAPMVWSVCRRLLNHHDAEDAFQTTFLVLYRKAPSILPREMVANWLYGVAHQTALHARRTTARRTAHEKKVSQMRERGTEEQDLWHDLRPVLDQELSHLPDKYRVVIVLCDLEGKTRKEAARQLGCPEGTVAGRLARAREMLAKRLARHGLAVTGGVLATTLAQNAAASVAPAVVSSTIKAATVMAAGKALATGAISSKVAALTEGMVKAMLLTKLKATAAVTIVVLGTTVIGGGLLSHHIVAAQAGPSESGGLDPKPAQLVAPKRDVLPGKLNDGSVGYIKQGPVSWRAVFAKALEVLAEHFDSLDANAYEGRIETWTFRVEGSPDFTRKAVVTFRPLDAGGYAINVCVYLMDHHQGAEPKPVGNDTGLERVILRQLNAQMDGKLNPPPVQTKSKETAAAKPDVPKERLLSFTITAKENRVFVHILPAKEDRKVFAVADQVSWDEANERLILQGKVEFSTANGKTASFMQGEAMSYSLKSNALWAEPKRD